MSKRVAGVKAGQWTEDVMHTGVACPRCEEVEVIADGEGFRCADKGCGFAHGDVSRDAESREFAARALAGELEERIGLQLTKSHRRLVEGHAEERAKARLEALDLPSE